MITKEYPDHHDADLVLRLYDLRRESVLRESRSAVYAKFKPASADEATAVLKPDHPLNPALRQVVVWEMVRMMSLHRFRAGKYSGYKFYAKIEHFWADPRRRPVHSPMPVVATLQRRTT